MSHLRTRTRMLRMEREIISRAIDTIRTWTSSVASRGRRVSIPSNVREAVHLLRRVVSDGTEGEFGEFVVRAHTVLRRYDNIIQDNMSWRGASSLRTTEFGTLSMSDLVVWGEETFSGMPEISDFFDNIGIGRNVISNRITEIRPLLNARDRRQF